MSRLARVVLPGIPHHVTQRGIRKTTTFLDVEDYQLYGRLLLKYSTQHGLRIHSYAWMPNHTHIVATPESVDSLESTFRPVNSVYAEEFNRKYGFSGYLWQSRYFSCPMDEGHFVAAVRYVERNPLRAGLVSSCHEYPWSSARAHCFGESDPLLDENLGILAAIQDWKVWLDQPNGADLDSRIRNSTVSGYPCGSEDFVREAERATGRILRPKPRGRKKIQSDEGPLSLFYRAAGSE